MGAASELSIQGRVRLCGARGYPRMSVREDLGVSESTREYL